MHTWTKIENRLIFLDTDFSNDYISFIKEKEWWHKEVSLFLENNKRLFENNTIWMNPILYWEQYYSIQLFINQQERWTESAIKKEIIINEVIEYIENENLQLFNITKKTAQIFSEIKSLYKKYSKITNENLKKDNHDIWIVSICLEYNWVLLTCDNDIKKIGAAYNESSKKYGDLEYYYFK